MEGTPPAAAEEEEGINAIPLWLVAFCSPPFPHGCRHHPSLGQQSWEEEAGGCPLGPLIFRGGRKILLRMAASAMEFPQLDWTGFHCCHEWRQWHYFDIPFGLVSQQSQEDFRDI
jgi:hypothetical protein